jgi:glycosyltransferase involved in cell wall biosynthesis
MRVALVTTFLAGYRVPLYERLAQELGVEVLCYGRGERYVGEWFRDLDAQLAAARFPARRLRGAREAFALGRRYDAVISPVAGGTILPAAYLGARAGGARFVLWASVWAQPRSARHALALPLTRRIYRDADAVVAYGEHVRRFVARLRGHDDDVYVAPQTVEPELFRRPVPDAEIAAWRAAHGIPPGPLALYCGRLVPEKGVGVLLAAWRTSRPPATLVVVGDGPLAQQARATAGVRFLGPQPRNELPTAYAAALFALLPSIPTPLFREPWGLVCNEAMHQGRPVIATSAVGAVAGGLVRHADTGLVVPAGDVTALAAAVDRLLADDRLRTRLGAAARCAAAAHTYAAMTDAFKRALQPAARAR